MVGLLVVGIGSHSTSGLSLRHFATSRGGRPSHPIWQSSPHAPGPRQTTSRVSTLPSHPTPTPPARLLLGTRAVRRTIRGFRREYKRLARQRSGLLRRLSVAEREEIAADARRAAVEELLVELFGFYDGLCGAYLATELPQHSALLRANLGEQPALFEAFWSYAEQAPELIRGADDGRLLELGLAAVSLDDDRVDLQQCEAVLGRLYLAATRVGLDAKPHFAAVAAVSNPGTGGGGSRTQGLVAGFDRSFYFEQHVRPQVSRTSA